ncbi:MAG TPA: hypothetical protein VKB79_10715 [Bryobacteraceae bacterium]|nr:hypothetical protein [Bryobacteraceae bacterium]
MKIAGFLLLFSGWLLILAAIALLPAGMSRNIFALAGGSVEALGLILAVRSHLPVRSDRG